MGPGSALVLKNAQNPLRRNDKDSSYVGNGNFLRLIAHDNAAGISRDLFFIDQNGGQVWTGATTTAGTGGRARFLANKADDGQMAYFFELTSPHLKVASFSNVLNIRNDNSLMRAALQSASAQTGGLMLESHTGPVFLVAQGGASYIQTSSPFRFVSALMSATAGSDPSAVAAEGFINIQISGGGSKKIPYYPA